jgi:hypothetical protein
MCAFSHVGHALTLALPPSLPRPLALPSLPLSQCGCACVRCDRESKTELAASASRLEAAKAEAAALCSQLATIKAEAATASKRAEVSVATRTALSVHIFPRWGSNSSNLRGGGGGGGGVGVVQDVSRLLSQCQAEKATSDAVLSELRASLTSSKVRCCTPPRTSVERVCWDIGVSLCVSASESG